MGFFSWRRKRESAIPPSNSDPEALGSFARGDDQPVVGRQVSEGGISAAGSPFGALEGLAGLSGLAPMIEEAIKAGNAQVRIGEPRRIDAGSTGLGEEIKAILRRNGIDPDSGSASINAADYDDVQRELLQALARHGIDLGMGGSGPDSGGEQS